ncbi:DUF2726 domain-containing protein [Robertmurraya sp.]|jgi:tetratricopeptide (TPR) repeat protein|uniref:DUF2726 domain-containing protein n=1 Tax=Robertmurraya sp. TaxID=2837525 RepID=UPI0037036ECE
MNETHDLLEKYQIKLKEGIREYRDTKDSLQFRAKIDEIVSIIASMDNSNIKTDEMFESYMGMARDLVYYSLELKDFHLGDSIYKRLCPGLPTSFLQEKDIDKKKKQWGFYSDLVMNYFTIQHNLNGISSEQLLSLGMVLKWFKRYNGYFDTDKPLFIDMLIDTHSEWKELITPEEEETFWTELTNWMIQDFLNAVSDNLTLYKKVKSFYTSYKKTKRLDPLAYRVVEYAMLIVGVAEKKLEYTTLVDKASSFLKHMKEPFCKRQGEGLSEIFSEIITLWIPTGHFSDTQLLGRIVRESNSTTYKKEVFSKIITYGIDLSKWYKNKAYSLVAYAYEEELFSEKKVESHRFEIAFSLANGKKYEKAKKLYEELIQNEQGSGAVLNNLAVIYRDIDKNYDKALEFFELAAKNEPEEELFQRNIKTTMEMIKKEKEKPKRQIENYFKKTDKQLKSICFTIYKLEDLDKVTIEDIENATSFKGTYLKKHLSQLENLELIFFDAEKGWKLESPIRVKVASYVDPKLERQIIRNNRAVMYRPIFYHEAEITLYRVLTELFPQHFVFPNMDLKTIIQVEKIRDYIGSELLDYLFKAHVDFAIIETKTYFPILTFERDSEFQDVEPQKSNAVKKNTIFETSGLPLIRIRYNSAMDYERLKEEIKQATKEYILQISGNTDAETRRILESIDPKRFGILKDLPSDDELKEAWKKLVGNMVAAHTNLLEFDQEQCVLRVTVEETARPVLELGAESIKSKLYQQFPILNSVQFYWS